MRAHSILVLTLLSACSSSPEALPPTADAGGGGAADAGSPDAPPQPASTSFSGVTAVKAVPAGDGWAVLLETLQPQLVITRPLRRIALLDERLAPIATLDPPAGWTLLDVAGHPSGDVTALYLRVDPTDPLPLRIQLTRHRRDGSRVDFEVPPVAPATTDPSLLLVASYDRARVVASGEEVTLAARWAGNSVHAARFAFAGGRFEPRWSTRVEPEAELSVLGIIGGGFDNFHQGDNKIFVYVDVDAAGDAYVAVPSGIDVLAQHDAAFGEHLSDGADPERFDFGTAILTRLEAAEGKRVYARLLGVPGRGKSLLGLRAAGDAVLLLGRVKTSGEADGWDGWLLRATAATGAQELERAIDVEHGDMFWDAAALPGGRELLAVGSTGYTQNPSGLSVSDARDALAVRLDAEGRVLERLPLPRGPEGRGNEAIGVSLRAGLLAVAGMLDGPGTHAEVRSNGFFDLRLLTP